jgi:hypothetical protein
VKRAPFVRKRASWPSSDGAAGLSLSVGAPRMLAGLVATSLLDVRHAACERGRFVG